ncbi:uncharacterized protein LOC111085980 [Limulus polyphemus]|uniref:Uncharacterized protein LOC111085980 n=1 Tax=Limulus polyphemus TaxID=6850 RepID=A0ABM1SGJ6_LIMPO|nr:uncharacterized protein LOC111085980 [Limulus polyphemus]
MNCHQDQFMWELRKIIAVFSILFMAETLALRNVKVQVPSAVNRGDTAWINCSFDLESDEIYSTKFYLNDLEFFRYISYLDDTPVSVYPFAGIYVDKGKSSFASVFMYTTDFNSEGNYKCEVSIGPPTFQTIVSKPGYMLVNVPPRHIPIINGVRLQYARGENLTGTCISARSKPPSTIKWYINDKEVSSKFVRIRILGSNPNDYVSVVSDIHFTVQPHHFVKSRMFIRCTSYFNELEYSRVIDITDKDNKNNWIDSAKRNSASSSFNGRLPLVFVLLCIRRLVEHINYFLPN